MRFVLRETRCEKGSPMSMAPEPTVDGVEEEQHSVTEALQADMEQAERRSGKDRRQSVVDRRSGLDRRKENRGFDGLERRRGPGRRRSDERRCAEEGEMTEEQFEFIMAIEEYKKRNKKPFPTWTEVLEVIKYLGYHKD